MSKRAIGGLPNSPSEEVKQGKNHLFAIGIDSYQYFTPLRNARKDIEDLAEVLVDQYDFEREDIQLICDQEATKDNIIDHLDGLRRKVGPGDKLLIYYSGHGYTDTDRGFWIPVDAEPSRVSSYLANAEVRDIIQSIKARHILLISDSCFSASLLVRDISSDMGGAFKDWEKNPSRWAFISGKGVVSDGKEGENSPFAAGIIKNLRENDEDAINIIKLADRVTHEIRFNYEQQAEVCPLFQAGHAGGQFVFVKKQTEKEEWASATRNNTEGSYLEYLNKYPQGLFVKEAEHKLVDIADETEWESATLRNAAFAYRQYLQKYPQGKHAAEAENKLDKIEEEDRLEKAEERRQEQDRIFKLEMERKTKELSSKPEPERIPVQKAAIKKEQPVQKPDEIKPEKRTNYLMYSLFTIGGAILIAGYLLWPKINGSESSAGLPVADTAVVVPPISDGSREIEGKVTDSKSTPNPLAGASVTNKRTGQSATTDANGNYKLAGTRDGDTLTTAYTKDYAEAINIVLKDQVSGIIQLQEIPRIKEQKPISGYVKLNNGAPIYRAYLKVLRNNKFITGTHTDNKGHFKFSKVNEGDVIEIDGGKSYSIKKRTVTEQNEYDIIMN